MTDGIGEVSPHTSISVEEIKTAFQPPARFRVSPNLYQPGTSFPGTGREHQVILLGGTVEIVIDGRTTTIGEGHRAVIPAGTYWLTVKGDLPCSLVNVFDLDAIRSGIV
jgi:hypothetical protein